MKQLETERILLREWEVSDAEAFYNNSCGRKVGPMAGWKPHESLEESKAILQMFMQSGDSWAAILKDGGKLIGSVGLHKDKLRDGVDDTYMLGYVLAEKYWGRGIMYEICREVIRYVFEERNARLLSVRHFTFNEQSKRVIQKCGFVYEGTLRQLFKRPYDGKVFDSACYSMTRQEFLANRRVNHSNDIQREQRYAVVRMSRVSANAFLEWRYEPPFDIYTCPETAFDSTLHAILNQEDGREYFAVYDSLGNLFGMYSYVFAEEGKLQIEFRMRPEMTGKGYGAGFAKECIRYGRAQYDYKGDIVLKIALCNVAAIDLLQSMGFVETYRDEELYYGNKVEYIHMELKAEQ